MLLNNNKQRRQWWEYMQNYYSRQEIGAAMALLKPETQMVIRLHYGHNLPFKDIASALQRSVTMVRHHQCRGIFLLYQHFNKPEK